MSRAYRETVLMADRKGYEFRSCVGGYVAYPHDAGWQRVPFGTIKEALEWFEDLPDVINDRDAVAAATVHLAN